MNQFKLTDRQIEAQSICGSASSHIMLFGGSRSGKTFLLVRNTVMRAMKAPNSRHLIARFRLNHIVASIVLDTFPKVMELAFNGIEYKIDKKNLFVEFENGSQIWFAGLDDKERTEKVLGQEYVTIYLNECSQIPFGSRNIVLTRLAQKVVTEVQGMRNMPLKPRMYYDCNPPPKSHWTYKLFVEKRDPETGNALLNGLDYASLQMNPGDNVENLSEEYLQTLEGLSERLKRRFLRGEFADANPNQLFNDDWFHRWRIDKTIDLPDFVRVVVGVDPSGSGDVDNADNDAIGIVVAGLGTDGNAYVLEDCTVKAGPGTWGKVAVNAYERHEASVIIGEINFGGAMVEAVIKASNNRVPFKAVTASRGKIQRAEPFSALYEQGKVRHVGPMFDLEDELNSFSTVGFIGERSPNRADALIWALAELFPAIVVSRKKEKKQVVERNYGVARWMG